MRVRSPRISDGYEESSPSISTRSHELVAFAHDSDAVVFLPKNVALSHHEEDVKGDVVAEKEEVDKVEVWKSKAWRFLVQPCTWISMVCR